VVVEVVTVIQRPLVARQVQQDKEALAVMAAQETSTSAVEVVEVQVLLVVSVLAVLP
jgi:hypothetical protein